MTIFSDYVENIKEIFMDDFLVLRSLDDDDLNNLLKILQKYEETTLVLN